MARRVRFHTRKRGLSTHVRDDSDGRSCRRQQGSWLLGSRIEVDSSKGCYVQRCKDPNLLSSGLWTLDAGSQSPLGLASHERPHGGRAKAAKDALRELQKSEDRVSRDEGARVIAHVMAPVVASRVPGDGLDGGSRSRSGLAVAADRGWFDSAAKWAVDVENDRVAPAPSSVPTKIANVRLFFIINFYFLASCCRPVPSGSPPVTSRLIARLRFIALLLLSDIATERPRIFHPIWLPSSNISREPREAMTTCHDQSFESWREGDGVEMETGGFEPQPLA